MKRPTAKTIHEVLVALLCIGALVIPTSRAMADCWSCNPCCVGGGSQTVCAETATWDTHCGCWVCIGCDISGSYCAGGGKFVDSPPPAGQTQLATAVVVRLPESADRALFATHQERRVETLLGISGGASEVIQLLSALSGAPPSAFEVGAIIIQRGWAPTPKPLQYRARTSGEFSILITPGAIQSQMRVWSAAGERGQTVETLAGAHQILLARAVLDGQPCALAIRSGMYQAEDVTKAVDAFRVASDGASNRWRPLELTTSK